MTNERVWLVHKRDNYQNCKDENGYPTRRNFPEVTIDEIPSEVLSKTTIDIVAKIKDTDNTVFTYEVLLADYQH